MLCVYSEHCYYYVVILIACNVHIFCQKGTFDEFDVGAHICNMVFQRDVIL